MADKINVLIPEETVDAKIKEIGEQISKDYAGKEVHLICILKGGVFFACELAKRITVPDFSGLYAGIQLRRCDREFRNRSY